MLVCKKFLSSGLCLSFAPFSALGFGEKQLFDQITTKYAIYLPYELSLNRLLDNSSECPLLLPKDMCLVIAYRYTLNTSTIS